MSQLPCFAMHCCILTRHTALHHVSQTMAADKQLVVVQFTDESGFLFLEGVNISSVRTFAESANCCMLFAPVYHHLVMAFDIAHLGPTSSAWQLQDNTTQNIWRRMHSVEYSRLHVTPTFIAVCFHQGLVCFPTSTHNIPPSSSTAGSMNSVAVLSIAWCRWRVHQRGVVAVHASCHALGCTQPAALKCRSQNVKGVPAYAVWCMRMVSILR